MPSAQKYCFHPIYFFTPFIRKLQKGGMTMAKTIIWETKMDAALNRAKAESKHILLDFFNPG